MRGTSRLIDDYLNPLDSKKRGKPNRRERENPRKKRRLMTYADVDIEEQEEVHEEEEEEEEEEQSDYMDYGESNGTMSSGLKEKERILELPDEILEKIEGRSESTRMKIIQEYQEQQQLKMLLEQSGRNEVKRDQVKRDDEEVKERTSKDRRAGVSVSVRTRRTYELKRKELQGERGRSRSRKRISSKEEFPIEFQQSLQGKSESRQMELIKDYYEKIARADVELKTTRWEISKKKIKRSVLLPIFYTFTLIISSF